MASQAETWKYADLPGNDSVFALVDFGVRFSLGVHHLGLRFNTALSRYPGSEWMLRKAEAEPTMDRVEGATKVGIAVLHPRYTYRWTHEGSYGDGLYAELGLTPAQWEESWWIPVVRLALPAGDEVRAVCAPFRSSEVPTDHAVDYPQ